jgi:hypothetical protein
MFSGSNADAFERVRLTRLAADLILETFGGRQTLFEIFNATGTAQIRGQLLARFDTKPYKDLAKAVAGMGDTGAAARAIEASWSVSGDTAFSTYDDVGAAYQSRNETDNPTGR